MDFGVGLARALTASRHSMVRLARQAEDLEFHSLWVAEHIAMPVSWQSRYPFTDDGVAPFDHLVEYTEAMVTLGFLAGVTERIRLGSSVIPIITRDPLSLAKQAATVDIASGGRLELGLGAGWLLEEATLLGKPFDHPAGRLDEMVGILGRAWTEETFEHHGTYYDFGPAAVHPQPVQAAIPIWIGGTGERLLRIAAESHGGVIIPARSDAETVAMVESTRGKVPDATGIAAVMLGDADRDRDRRFVRDLEAAGATMVILQLPADADLAAARLTYYQSELRPAVTTS